MLGLLAAASFGAVVPVFPLRRRSRCAAIDDADRRPSGAMMRFVEGPVGKPARPAAVFYEPAVPDPNDPLAGYLGFDEVQWPGPTPVMLDALALVQADLDAAGLNAIRLSFALAGGSDEYPIVNVQWRGTWTSDSIDLDENDLSYVTVDVAGQVAQGLIELEGTYFPTCPTHNRRVVAGVSVRREAVWACNISGVPPHLLAAVGQLHLIRGEVRRGGALWRSLADLGRP